MPPAETSEAGASSLALSLSLSPQGRLHVDVDLPAGADLASPLEQIAKHFARGDGHGVFRLGAAEPETPLPGVLGFWRDVGRAFVVRLCATEDSKRCARRLTSTSRRTSWPRWPPRRRR